MKEILPFCFEQLSIYKCGQMFSYENQAYNISNTNKCKYNTSNLQQVSGGPDSFAFLSCALVDIVELFVTLNVVDLILLWVDFSWH